MRAAFCDKCYKIDNHLHAGYKVSHADHAAVVLVTCHYCIACHPGGRQLYATTDATSDSHVKVVGSHTMYKNDDLVRSFWKKQ